MKFFNRLGACLLITGLISLSACVLAGPGYDSRGARQTQGRYDHDNGRHHDTDRRCDTDRHDGDCRDREHH